MKSHNHIQNQTHHHHHPPQGIFNFHHGPNYNVHVKAPTRSRCSRHSPKNDTCATCLNISANDPMREVCQASILSSHRFGYFASSPPRLIDGLDGSSPIHMDKLVPFQIIGAHFLRSVSSRKSTKKELKDFYR